MTGQSLLSFACANASKLVLPTGETTVSAAVDPLRPPWRTGWCGMRVLTSVEAGPDWVPISSKY
jgi:hypothetical protein